MRKTKNLIVFPDAERFAFYGLPDFDTRQRCEYFSFSAEERVLINYSTCQYNNVICALQLGYFKAKKLFFQIPIHDEQIKVDIEFIIANYFTGLALEKVTVTSHAYYAQRRSIACFMGYTLWTPKLSFMLHERAAQLIQRDITPHFIGRELLAFLEEKKVVRPGYTILQRLVSNSLTMERKRISTILDSEINQELRRDLDKLMLKENGIVKLSALKQDAKNFGFKMMLQERHKHNILTRFYPETIGIIKKLSISQHNVEYYGNLAIYYSPWDLGNLKHNHSYLYLLCYIIKRYQQITDNLVEAFTYQGRKLENNIKQKAKLANAINSQNTKIGRLLLYYTDKKLADNVAFSVVRKRAFKTMPKDKIEVLGQQLISRGKYKKELYWQEVDKAHRLYKKNLRPLFATIEFSCKDVANPWVTAISLLQSTFKKQTHSLDFSLGDLPNETIPRYLKPYLLAKNAKNSEHVRTDRYEYWLYKQLAKQMSEGKIYCKNSVHHGCFSDELTSLDSVSQLQLKVPWLQQLPNQQLDYLLKKLDKLWVLLNKQFKQGKLPHLRYHTGKQKFSLRKIKANDNSDDQNRFYAQIPIRDINEVIYFVDEKCHFLSLFTPLQPRYAKGSKESPDKLIAAILAQAFGYGNHRMSQASDVSYSELEITTQQYLRLATLRTAIDQITNAISQLSIFPYYALDMALLYGATDGQKFALATPNIKARHSKKYLREGQGVSAYTMLANNVPLQSMVIGSHEHESYYLFDIWKNSSSSIIPTALTGDMHVINKANFAIMHWFGAKLQARLTSIHVQLQNLYCGGAVEKYKNCLIRPCAQINSKIIIDQKPMLNQLFLIDFDLTY